jgi:UDP-hydrolysing UDP-N-acetyl-D-glucosamine 2-epimerase
MLLSSDTPTGTAKSMGVGLLGFADLFTRARPDTVVVMGDRFEMFAATAAALPFCIPVAHIHGGELSEGAIDDAMRHAITKMSHLHFVSTEEHRRRVVQLGEEPERVFVCGAPALDNLKGFNALPKQALERRFGFDLSEAPLLVTFHPTTLEVERTEADTAALLAALKASGHPVIFTAPNADPAGRIIRAQILRYVSENPRAWFVENLGLEGYYSLLHYAWAMVGNSSSGIIEAASFRLPVVNVGNRQRRRYTGPNVLHVVAEQKAIEAAIQTGVSPQFRKTLDSLVNPYGDGSAASRIAEVLRTTDWSSGPCVKRFHDSESRH